MKIESHQTSLENAAIERKKINVIRNPKLMKETVKRRERVVKGNKLLIMKLLYL